MTARKMRDATLLFVALAGCGATALARQPATETEDMRFVPGATFRMGSSQSEIERIGRALGLRNTIQLKAEVPSHSVQVADFFMDTHTVSNRDYARFVAANPTWAKVSLPDSEHNGRYLEHWTEDGPPERLHNHPVTFITWPSAVAYCAWRGKRLPTEAEYEWASQDGETRHEYPWGDDAPRDGIVSWGGNGINTTVPVGSYAPNPRGLYDMSGNVWHFTSTPWFGSYAETMAMKPSEREEATHSATRRVVRGGSWGANSANLRVRYRDSHRPLDAREMVGFRCAVQKPI
ncbi:MAG: SUMF1/EgtB/PvdO family nonheme iron enzyme [Pseudomonadota bacterium]